MKKNLFILLFCFYNSLLFSQIENSFTFSSGFIQEKSIGYFINYNYSSSNSNYEVGIMHSSFVKEIKSEITTKFSTTVLQLGYLQSIFKNRNNSLSFNVGGGTFGGVETIPDNNQIVITSKSGFFGGLYGVALMDIYISERIGLLIRGQQNYNLFTTTGKTNPYLGAGIKINF